MVLGALGGPDAGATQGSILNRRFDDNKSPKLDQTDATTIGLIIAFLQTILALFVVVSIETSTFSLRRLLFHSNPIPIFPVRHVYGTATY